MKILILLVVSSSLVACASAPKPQPSGFGADFDSASKEDQIYYLKYLVESERQVNAEKLKAMEEANAIAVPEIPSSDVLVQQVCVKTPIYDVYGRYVRTTVRCK